MQRAKVIQFTAMSIRLNHAPLLVLILALPCLAREPDNFADAIKLTKAEATALADVADKSPQIDETAFYMMLAKAAAIAELASPYDTLVDSPAAAQLLTNPQRWRGWPVRLQAIVYRIEKLQGRKHLSPSPHWSVNRPVWKLSGTAMSDPNISIVAFSVVNPPRRDQPDSIETDNSGIEVQTFNNGTPVVYTGFSYKVWSTKDTEGRVQNYPVIIPWLIGLVIPADEASSPGSLGKLYQTVALGMALLIGYLFLKVYTRRLGKADPSLQRANRIESFDAEPGAETGRETGDAEPQIDPLLKAAAEQYAKDTQDDVESKDN